jgi:hypothetical protein
MYPPPKTFDTRVTIGNKTTSEKKKKEERDIGELPVGFLPYNSRPESAKRTGQLTSLIRALHGLESCTAIFVRGDVLLVCFLFSRDSLSFP